MQDNFSEWEIYIPSIAYINENLLYLSENNLSLCLQLGFLISSRDMAVKMTASMESYCELYEKLYLLNRSSDLHKICGKMLASLIPFTEVTVKVCWPFPLILYWYKKIENRKQSVCYRGRFTDQLTHKIW